MCDPKLSKKDEPKDDWELRQLVKAGKVKVMPEVARTLYPQSTTPSSTPTPDSQKPTKSPHAATKVAKEPEAEA